MRHTSTVNQKHPHLDDGKPTDECCANIASEGHGRLQGGRTTDERRAQAPWRKLAFAGLKNRLDKAKSRLAVGISPLGIASQKAGLSMNATVGRKTESWIREWMFGPGWLGIGTALKLAVGMLGMEVPTRISTAELAVVG
mgnify:FL=1